MKIAYTRKTIAAAALAAFGLVTTAAKLYVIQLDSFAIGPYSVSAGASTTGVATLTGMTKSPIPVVSFTSSNTMVASVPASRVASANGTVTVPVSAWKAGCARISASYGGSTRIDDIVVHPVATTTAFTLTVPDQFLILGGRYNGTVSAPLKLSDSSPTGTGGTLEIQRATILLSSSDPKVAKVPASVTQLSTTTGFPITGTGDGCAIITATIGNNSVSKTVRVFDIGG